MRSTRLQLTGKSGYFLIASIICSVHLQCLLSLPSYVPRFWHPPGGDAATLHVLPLPLRLPLDRARRAR